MSADEPTEEQKALAVVLSLAQGNKQPAGSGEGGGGSDGESNSTSSDEEDEAESSPVVAREDRGVSEAEAKDDLAAAGGATDSKPDAASPMRPPRGLPPMPSLAEGFDGLTKQ
uniref:Uncharacterized protein n=1 Tax=Florenciella parvula TaxID=236787 RepID=A0A6T7EAR7_9STRA|mmetsp:Transcript_24406/g.50439  ORF Transcript_24406/g.50439 Transcript_24406/m.50439 type:complete len:113 (+) Transcript_24406:734-1072(+)